MAKSSAARPVIAPGRVDAALHQEVKAAAAASGRSMAEELTELARRALEHLRRFPNSLTAQAFEMATLGFIIGGENEARQKGITDWTADLECRRQAALSACTTLICYFVSNDPREQARTVEELPRRIWREWTVNPPRGEGGAS
jgi:hypothetical protein